MKISFIFLVIIISAACSFDHTFEDELAWKMIIKSEEKEPVKIELFGEQFKWTVRYAGVDNELLDADYKLINEDNPLGVITTESIDHALVLLKKSIADLENTTNLDSEGEDDHQSEIANKKRILSKLEETKVKFENDVFVHDDFWRADTLFLAVDQEYTFQFRSKDVIHSAYFPHFRAHMNTVPGMITRFNYSPIVTTEAMRKKKNVPDFEFTLLCNKICGSGHFDMKIVVRVLEREEYDSWINSQVFN